MKRLNNSKGITLITLVVTVIILIMLATTVTYMGTSSIKNNKFERLKVELEMVQANVDLWYDQFKDRPNEEISVGSPMPTSKEAEANASIAMAKKINPNVDETIGRYRYFGENEFEYLQIEGIENEYIIDIKNQYAIILNGYEYGGTEYYLIDQVRDTIRGGAAIDETVKIDYFTLNDDKIYLKDTKTVTAQVYPDNATETLTWTSSNSNIVEIVKTTGYNSNVATIKGVNPGIVKLTAKNSDGSIVNEARIICNLKEGTIATENTEYFDDNEEKAIIPKGFCVVNNSSPISEGLVISDVAEDNINNDKGGNQFVWIPVDGETIKYERHEYATKTFDDENKLESDSGNGNWGTYSYRNYTDWKDEGGNSTSVSTYKGFYIARFEAGIPIDAKAGTAYGTSTAKNVTTYKPVSKKGSAVWNFINQTNAKIASEKMYDGSTSVTSSLVDNYAWDTICTWLASSGYNVVGSKTTDDNASNYWGNYTNTTFSINGLYVKHPNGSSVASTYSSGNYIKIKNELVEIGTGVAEKNKANNIYDFAGNMFEWTTETGMHNATVDTYGVRRGGAFNHDTSYGASAITGLYACSETMNHTGFRVVLYLK